MKIRQALEYPNGYIEKSGNYGDIASNYSNTRDINKNFSKAFDEIFCPQNRYENIEEEDIEDKMGELQKTRKIYGIIDDQKVSFINIKCNFNKINNKDFKKNNFLNDLNQLNINETKNINNNIISIIQANNNIVENDKESLNFDNLSQLGNNKLKNNIKRIENIPEDLSQIKTKDNTSKNIYIEDNNFIDSIKKQKYSKFIKNNTIKEEEEEEDEIKSVTYYDDDEELSYICIELDEEQPKNEEEETIQDIIIDKRKDNSRNEALKAPIPKIKQIIEEIIDTKLKDVNLNFLFGSIARDKKILKLKMYQIFCYEKENRKIIKNSEPKNEDDEKIFYFLLSSQYKFLYRQYYSNNRTFKIDGKNITILKFPILKEITKERKKKFYNNDTQKIKNFEEACKSVYNNFEDIKGRKSKKGKDTKKLKKVILRKFENKSYEK